MTARKAIWGALALLLWLTFPALVIVAGLGLFVAPAKVDEWKAQGVTQAPTAWQLVIDGSDMVKNRWFVVFPVLALAATAATAAAVRTGSGNKASRSGSIEDEGRWHA